MDVQGVPCSMRTIKYKGRNCRFKGKNTVVTPRTMISLSMTGVGTASPKKGSVVRVVCTLRSSSLLERKLPAMDWGAQLLQLPFRYIAWSEYIVRKQALDVRQIVVCYCIGKTFSNNIYR